MSIQKQQARLWCSSLRELPLQLPSPQHRREMVSAHLCRRALQFNHPSHEVCSDVKLLGGLGVAAGKGEPQRVSRTYLCGRDPLVGAFPLGRAPHGGVVGEVVHPHAALLVPTEHILFCCKNKRSSWKTSVGL